MTAFDIEAAKSGEPVEYDIAGGRYVPAHFIGVSDEGYMVIQHQITGSTKMTPAFCCQQSELRMAPKKIKVRWRVAAMRDSDGSAYTLSANTEGQMSNVQGLSNFIEWLTAWQEAEITE